MCLSCSFEVTWPLQGFEARHPSRLALLSCEPCSCRSTLPTGYGSFARQGSPGRCVCVLTSKSLKMAPSGNRCPVVTKCNLIKILETAAATNKYQKVVFSLKKNIKSSGRHSSLRRVWPALQRSQLHPPTLYSEGWGEDRVPHRVPHRAPPPRALSGVRP